MIHLALENIAKCMLRSDEFVFMNDKFPKSSVHLLLLPRDENIHKIHPWEALHDPEVSLGFLVL